MSFVSRYSLHSLMRNTSILQQRSFSATATLVTNRSWRSVEHCSIPQHKNSPRRTFFNAVNHRCVSTLNTPIVLPLVSNAAPNFTANAVFPDDSIKELTLSSFRSKKYVCLFFWPMDFTFVCPSEVLAYNHALQEFEKRNVQLLGVSTDSHFTHLAWRRTPPSEGGIGAISFPMISDHTKSISAAYRILCDDAVALRGLFLIDKEGIIRHSLVNDKPLGRNVEDTLRIIDALQHTEKYGEVCPANWRKGDKTILPTHAGVSTYLREKENA